MSSAKVKQRERKTQTKRPDKHLSTALNDEDAKSKRKDKGNKKRSPGLKVTSRNATSRHVRANKINGLFRLSTDAWAVIRQYLPPADAASLVTTCRTAYEMVLTDQLRGKTQEDMPFILRYEARSKEKASNEDRAYSFLVQTIKSKKSMERRVRNLKNNREEPSSTEHGQRLQIHIRAISNSIMVFKKTSKAKKWKNVYCSASALGADSVCPLAVKAVAKCCEQLRQEGIILPDQSRRTRQLHNGLALIGSGR